MACALTSLDQEIQEEAEHSADHESDVEELHTGKQYEAAISAEEDIEPVAIAKEFKTLWKAQGKSEFLNNREDMPQVPTPL